MKLIALTLMTLFSLNLIAKPVTEDLIENEIELAVRLANKYEVPLQVRGSCTKTEFDIVDTVKGFNPASWTLETRNQRFQLDGNEISELIKLYDRLEIPSEQANSITLKTKITITGISCGLSSNRWTVTFDDQQ